MEANERLGFPADQREYTTSVLILRELGVRSIRLMSNNPRKLAGVVGDGLHISERIPLEITPSDSNRRYLQTKKEKLGHQLSEVVASWDGHGLRATGLVVGAAACSPCRQNRTSSQNDHVSIASAPAATSTLNGGRMIGAIVPISTPICHDAHRLTPAARRQRRVQPRPHPRRGDERVAHQPGRQHPHARLARTATPAPRAPGSGRRPPPCRTAPRTRSTSRDAARRGRRSRRAPPPRWRSPPASTPAQRVDGCVSAPAISAVSTARLPVMRLAGPTRSNG